jgi:hypothetical protein
VLQVEIEGGGHNIRIYVKSEGEDEHSDQHDDPRTHYSKFVVLSGLIMKDVGQKHGRDRQPEDQIPELCQIYTEIFLPAMMSSLISCMIELVKFLSATTTDLFSEI